MINNAIPRPEFPNPNFERKDWINLNGKWEFEFDRSNSGKQRKIVEKEKFDGEIIVPFTFESELSGIGDKDFCECVWYKKTFDLPAEWKGKVIFHVGACDYRSEVWVNGQYAGFHRGGMTHFCFDITKYLKEVANTVVIRAEDLQRSGKQPIGKQSNDFHSSGCCYTRTTGIWQTVWLEHIPFESYIKSFKVYPDIANGFVTVNVNFSNAVKGAKLKVKALYGGEAVAAEKICTDGNNASVQLKINDVKLWDLGKGELYDLKIKYGKDGSFDTVYSYFGFRSVSIDGYKFMLNGRSVFQRLVLDQGFYPDGTWTAPTAEALENDIILSMEAGFNGARLHQKIFEPLFHYYADKHGYITWGEHGNWGMDYSAESYMNFAGEWLESIERDFNHPSIIGWCPHNETHRGQRRDDLAYLYRMTKQADPTRVCIDTSGYVHVETDIYDVHDYDQNPETFKARYLPMLEADNKGKFHENAKSMGPIEHLPYFVSEFGGTWWSDVSKETENHTVSWGYGKAPEEIEEFYNRFEGLVSALLENGRICAFCYTQLTDVEQEQNGIYYYNRSKKFDSKRLHEIMTKKAAIED